MATVLLVIAIAAFDSQVDGERFKLLFVWRVLGHDNLVAHFAALVELAAKDRWEVPLS